MKKMPSVFWLTPAGQPLYILFSNHSEFKSVYMGTTYYIVHNPLSFDLMSQLDKKRFSPLDLLSHLTGLDAARMNKNNFLEYLHFDLSKERSGLTEHVCIAPYASYYIANQIANSEKGCRVFISDGRRRTIHQILDREGCLPDAVFISSLSSNFPAAAASAIALNHGGVPVILGGIHVSVRPEDVEQFIRPYIPHPDLVAHVCGPGDSIVIHEVLQDLKHHSLKPGYHGTIPIEDGVWGNPAVINAPAMKPEFLKRLPIIGHFLSAITRVNNTTPYLGCPFSCSFCSISTLPEKQRKFISRHPKDFVEEIETIQRNGPSYKNRFFMFLPDNLLIQEEILESILDRMIESDIKVNYISQISIHVAEKPRLLKKLRQSGASHLFVGFESLDLRNLEAVQKNSVEKIKNSGLSVSEYYQQVIKTIQNHGISVLGAFIFGLPYDYFHDLDHHTGRDIARFCIQNNIGLQAACLNDLPGSRNFRASQKNGSSLYGQAGSMAYFFSLCCADLMESNSRPPGALKNSPLITTYMAYDAAQKVDSDLNSLRMALKMARNAWRIPSKNGRRNLFDRFTDAVAACGLMMGSTGYRTHFEAVARSGPGRKGSFERLYEAEKDPDVKALFTGFLRKFES